MSLAVPMRYFFCGILLVMLDVGVCCANLPVPCSLKKIIKRYIKVRYDLYVMRQSFKPNHGL